MVSRRRLLTALAGASALTGCLGADDSDGTLTEPTTTPSATPPAARPDWVENDGTVESIALLEAHDAAVGRNGIRLHDGRDRVDSDEPIGTGLSAGELELETQTPEERLWLSIAAHGEEKHGYRLGFAEGSVGADAEQVRYMDESLLDSWVDLNREYLRAELAGEYPGGARRRVPGRRRHPRVRRTDGLRRGPCPPPGKRRRDGRGR